ncbi:uncharacterized protein LOC100374027 [Saccoglossus kowalevskii]|uniref:Poliovirus receptor-related protein 1-like n=1 Tax=Saccoglossus kowalevskii TaxID=10224 RepID=A0ABM0MI02_SACKO|nr:PREDICTED: poliovirus receptor-related protein 1-like [Saccoglossus kowalevskii]
MELLQLLILSLLMFYGLPQGIPIKIKVDGDKNASVGEDQVKLFCEYTLPILEAEIQSSYVEWEKCDNSNMDEGYIIAVIVNGQVDVFKPDKYKITETLHLNQPSLLISNVDLSDEATYWCKVNFILNTADGSPQLDQDTQSTVLTVQKPPSHVEIIDRGHNEQVGVNSMGEILLECCVYDSKPASPIAWYIDNQKIHRSIRNTVVKSENGTWTTHSFLTYVPSLEDNDSIIRCIYESNTPEDRYTDQVQISLVSRLVSAGQQKVFSSPVTIIFSTLFLFLLKHL